MGNAARGGPNWWQATVQQGLFVFCKLIVQACFAMCGLPGCNILPQGRCWAMRRMICRLHHASSPADHPPSAGDRSGRVCVVVGDRSGKGVWQQHAAVAGRRQQLAQSCRVILSDWPGLWGRETKTAQPLYFKAVWQSM